MCLFLFKKLNLVTRKERFHVCAFFAFSIDISLFLKINSNPIIKLKPFQTFSEIGFKPQASKLYLTRSYLKLKVIFPNPLV